MLCDFFDFGYDVFSVFYFGRDFISFFFECFESFDDIVVVENVVL